MPLVHDTAIETAAERRCVPLTLTASALFGGRATQTAWFFFAVSLVPIWWIVEVGQVDPMSAFTFWGETTTVDGEVVEIHEGKRRDLGHNDYYAMERVEIDGVRYRYLGSDARWHSASAWNLKEGRHDRYATLGASIPVEYSVKDPSLSRVSGLGRAAGGMDEMVVWLFWIAVVVGGVAGFAAIAEMFLGLGIRRLLSVGLPTHGELSTSEIVLPGVRRLTYRYPHDDGTGFFATLSTKSDDELITDSEPMLIDPKRQTHGIPISHIPGDLVINEDGELTEGDFNPYHYLWLPWVALIGYGWFVLHLLGISSPPGL